MLHRDNGLGGPFSVFSELVSTIITKSDELVGAVFLILDSFF